MFCVFTGIPLSGLSNPPFDRTEHNLENARSHNFRQWGWKMHRRYAIRGLYSDVRLRNFAKRFRERLSHWQIAEILFPLSEPFYFSYHSLPLYLSPLSFSFSLVSGANQTPPWRRFELFPCPETSRSTDVLLTDWKIRKFAVCVAAKERTSRERMRKLRLADPIR